MDTDRMNREQICRIIIEKIERGMLAKKSKVAKKESSYYKTLSLGFYISFSNIISLILINWIACRW